MCYTVPGKGRGPLGPRGEAPRDLAARLAPGTYHFTSPVERSGLSFARARQETGSAPFEAGILPAADIMSLHLTGFQGRAWSSGRLIHDGWIERRSLSLVKAGVQSDVRLQGRIDILQVFLPPKPLAEISAEVLGVPAQPKLDGWIFDRRLAALTIRAFRASASRHPAALLAAESLALKIAAHILKRHSAQGAPTRGRSPRLGGIPPQRMRRLIELIEHNLAGDLSLAELAASVHLSPFYFLRAFQHETGLTPHHWVMRRRIARSKELLANTDLSLVEVAAEIGYGSQSAFTTAFSRITGSSPGEWRRASRR